MRAAPAALCARARGGFIGAVVARVLISIPARLSAAGCNMRAPVSFGIREGASFEVFWGCARARAKPGYDRAFYCARDEEEAIKSRAVLSSGGWRARVVTSAASRGLCRCRKRGVNHNGEREGGFVGNREMRCASGAETCKYCSLLSVRARARGWV